MPPLRLYLTFSVLLVAFTSWNGTEIKLGNENIRFAVPADGQRNERVVSFAFMRQAPPSSGVATSIATTQTGWLPQARNIPERIERPGKRPCWITPLAQSG